jgi:hypothetical protein
MSGHLTNEPDVSGPRVQSPARGSPDRPVAPPLSDRRCTLPFRTTHRWRVKPDLGFTSVAIGDCRVGMRTLLVTGQYSEPLKRNLAAQLLERFEGVTAVVEIRLKPLSINYAP